jgi:hypothetical protein
VEVINITEETEVSNVIVKYRDIKLFQNASITVNNTIQPTIHYQLSSITTSITSQTCTVYEEDWLNSMLDLNLSKFQNWHHIVWGPDIFMVFFSSSRYCGILCMCLYTHTIKESAETNGSCKSFGIIDHKHRKCNNEHRWISDISGGKQNQFQWFGGFL